MDTNDNYYHKYLKYKAKYLALQGSSMVGGKKGATISKKQAKQLADKLNIDLDVVSLPVWTYGLNVELEHGKKLGVITNVTNDNLIMTAKIVIAHLLEFPDYYQRLKKMEKKADKYWKGRQKGSIFKED